MMVMIMIDLIFYDVPENYSVQHLTPPSQTFATYFWSDFKMNITYLHV